MGLISFVITGCARSATGYIAKAIEASGVYCSHERVFGNRTVYNGLPNIYKDELGTWGESSWWIPPLIHELPEQVAVLHQVRNPVKVIRSFWTLNFREFKWTKRGVPDWAFENRKDDDLLFYMKHWIAWNQLIESRETKVSNGVYYRYRIEDLRLPPKKTATELKTCVHWAKTALRVAEITGLNPTAFFDTIQWLKKDINHRMPKKHLTWQDIPESFWKERLRNLAARYGYTEAELAAA
jgi:hypothetical protein